MTFDSRAFRDALGCFATGVTVVSGIGDDGRPVGVTVNSFNSVSLEPALVLFSLDRTTASLKSFGVGRPFAVNVLHAGQAEVSRLFASMVADRWNGIGYETWDTGCPVLPDALAAFEGEVVANHDGGDHVIVVGRVRRLRLNREGTPLLYFRGRYAQLGPD